MLKKFTESMRERVQMFVAEMQAETGLSVVEKCHPVFGVCIVWIEWKCVDKSY